MRTILVAVVMIAAMGVGVAAADPTPAPSPGYQIPSQSGPVLPGEQVYPPACLTYPPACGLRFDPGTQTWQPRGDQ